MRSDHPSFNSIQEGFRHTSMSVVDAWLVYYSLGGSASSTRVGAFLTGGGDLEKPEQTILAQAINEFFIDRGQDHPVPYPESANLD